MASSVSASSSQSQNSGANQSTVTGNGAVTITNGYYSGLSSTARVYINGVSYDQAGPASMSQGQTHYWSYSVTFNHDANGYRGAVGVSVEFIVNGASFHNGSAGAATQGAIDYVRPTTTPGAPSIGTRNSAGTYVGVTSQTASNPAGVSDYNYQYSTDNSNWSADQGMGTGRYVNFGAMNKALNYYFRTRAAGDGAWGSYGASSVSLGFPSAPSGFSATSSTSVSNRITLLLLPLMVE
jgi:hypothetical protein